MRILALFSLILALAAPVAAQEPVVVELFTSQGCSSCPPADAFAHDLVERDPSVIVLAWHVDYWDYLGWKDVFSSREATARQEGYRQRWKLRSLYTPQIVVHGEAQAVGSKRDEVSMYIESFRAEAPMLSFELKSENGVAGALITPLVPDLPAAEVVIVRVTPEAQTMIERGENAGNTFTYVNVVREMTWLADWDGKDPIVVEGVDLDDDRYVLLVQAKDFGPILGARYLN